MRNCHWINDNLKVLTSGHFCNYIYSSNQKTLTWEDDLKNQFMTLNREVKIKDSNYAETLNKSCFQVTALFNNFINT